MDVLSWLDGLAPYAKDGTAFLAFFAAFGVAALWVYRTIIKPVHRKVERILDIADYQFVPNGGQSMRDAINRLEENHVDAQAHWASLEAGQDQLDRKVSRVERNTGQIDRRVEKLEIAIEKLKEMQL